MNYPLVSGAILIVLCSACSRQPTAAPEPQQSAQFPALAEFRPTVIEWLAMQGTSTGVPCVSVAPRWVIILDGMMAEQQDYTWSHIHACAVDLGVRKSVTILHSPKDVNAIDPIAEYLRRGRSYLAHGNDNEETEAYREHIEWCKAAYGLTQEQADELLTNGRSAPVDTESPRVLPAKRKATAP